MILNVAFRLGVFSCGTSSCGIGSSVLRRLPGLGLICTIFAPNILVLFRRTMLLGMLSCAWATLDGRRDMSLALRPLATSRIDFIRPSPPDRRLICRWATLVTLEHQ